MNKSISFRKNPIFDYSFPFAIILIVTILICTLYKYNLILFGGSCLLAVAVLSYRPSRFKNTFFITAILIEIPINFYCLTYLKAWEYSNPTPLLGFPIWEPILWTIGYIMLGEISLRLQLLLQRNISRALYKILIGTLLLTLVLYICAAFSNIDIIYVSWYLMGLVIVLILAHQSFNLIYFYVSAIIGTCFELVTMHSGVWHYTHPYFSNIGMPISLPLAYGISANVIWGITMLVTRTKRGQPRR